MRDADELQTLDGMKYLASVPEGEVINSMAEWKGDIFVATNKHVYVLRGEKRLERIGE